MILPQEDRARVLTQLGINMVVEAGAGTGKTTLLIDRLCLCVLVQKIPVEKLVALTFTDKAAAEIKTRFMTKLQQLVHAIRTGTKDRTLNLVREQFGLKDDDIITRCENTLARLDRASIGTIHSFCAEILKAFPLEAGLAPNAQIDTGQKARYLFEVRWNHFLDEELGLEATRGEQWKTVLPEISLPQLKDFAQELSRVMPVEYNYFAQADFLARFCQTKSARAQALYNLYVAEGKKPRALEKALQWAAISLQRTAAFLTQTPVPPKPEEDCPNVGSASYKNWDPQDTEEAKSIIGFAQAVTPEKQTLFLTAYQLVLPLAQQVRNDCQAAGVLSFDDLIIKTRNLLQQNLYVRRLLKEKFDALFIDEFQDTDPLQGELLLFLAEVKPGTAARWDEVQLQPGKLFVVGDPKQSIYRFRGADITAYDKFTQHILSQKGEKCFLRQNFRCKPDIIEVTNRVCSQAMVQEDSFQPAYEPIFTPDTTRAQAVEWLYIQPDPSGAAGADDYRHNQAERMAQWIKENVGKLQLAEGRPLALRDIAILMRAGTTISIYMDALRRYGLAFNTEVDKDFFRKQEINDFLLFLRAVADPSDTIALAGVLRSPFGGLSDEELLQLGQQHFAQPALEAHPKAAPCWQLIKHFSKQVGRVSLQTLMQTILSDTFLPEACAAAYEGERTLAHLHQFASWAAQYEFESGGTLLSFLADLQSRLAENPDELALPPATETRDALSLLTVHKSKGLEFPVVILADIPRKEVAGASRPATHLFAWQYHMYGLRAGKISDVHLAFLEEEQKKHSKCEEARILYVALTRSKEKLLLLSDGRDGAGKTILPFAAAGLLPDGTVSILTGNDHTLSLPVHAFAYCPPKDFKYKQVVSRQDVPDEAPEALAGWHRQYEKRQADYQYLLQHPKHTPSEGGEWLSEAQQQAAELGTICHRALEKLLGEHETDVAAACAQAAHASGAPARQPEVLELITSFVESPLFKQLKQHKLLACEMPFSRVLADGTTQNGVMDAVLQTPAGEIWVLDYKTDRVSSGQEEALVEAKYHAQLDSYQTAARQIFPQQRVRCFAVFVRTFAAVELEKLQ